MAERSQLQFVWKQIAERAQNIISPITFDNLIRDIEPIDIQGRKIVLKVPTEQNANTIIAHKIGEKLREAIVNSDCAVTDFRL